MFLSFYNPDYIGDTLLLLKKETDQAVSSQTNGKVTRVYITDTNETVAYNIFEISKLFSLSTKGQVLLNPEQVNQLNKLLLESGFDEISVDTAPKFVIGYVEECVKHPDSDHLHITKVRVSNQELLQIVCGAANVSQGQLVVVAKIGAVMPSGLIIWPGQLRGVESQGMLCSERELGLTDSPEKKGILILEEGQVGDPFPIGR